MIETHYLLKFDHLARSTGSNLKFGDKYSAILSIRTLAGTSDLQIQNMRKYTESFFKFKMVFLNVFKLLKMMLARRYLEIHFWPDILDLAGVPMYSAFGGVKYVE
jgi:hypothetical protein